MTLLQILGLAVIQGAAELLPVSSSAHVIVAEKMGSVPTIIGNSELLFLKSNRTSLGESTTADFTSAKVVL